MANDTKTTKPADASGAHSKGDTLKGADELAEVDFDIPDLGPDGIDPELYSLPRKSTVRIGPVMSISVLVFSVYVMVKLYPDLRFSRSDEQPTHYDTVELLLKSAEAEQLVSVAAVPDRSFAVHVAHSQADDGSRLTPAQGSDGKLWILIGGNVWNTAIDYREFYAGRLRRLADMPFYDGLVTHVRARGPGPRFLRVNDVRRAIDENRAADGSVSVLEPAGDTVALRGDTPVQIYETVADRVRIHIFPTDRMGKKEQLRGALLATGLIGEGDTPERGLADSWIYTVDVTGGVEAARTRLIEAKLFSARALPVKRLHETTFGELKNAQNLLTIGKSVVLWANVSWISVEVPRTVPGGAMVLLTMEHPTTYWYVLPLFVFLALAILFFLFALVRALRYR